MDNFTFMFASPYVITQWNILEMKLSSGNIKPDEVQLLTGHDSKGLYLKHIGSKSQQKLNNMVSFTLHSIGNVTFCSM